MERRRCRFCDSEFLDTGSGRCPYCGATNHQEEQQPSTQNNRAPFVDNPYNQVLKVDKGSKAKSKVLGVISSFIIVAIAILCAFVFVGKGSGRDAYVAATVTAHTVKWNSSAEATSYNVYLDGENVGNTVNTEYNISNYLIDDANYKVEVKAVDAGGQETLLHTLTYNYKASSKQDFARKPSFFINGQTYDYIISSAQEYEAFVWHNILYRKNNVRCYIDTDQITRYNVDSKTRSAINNYPEYDAVNGASVYATYSNNVATLTNFTYYLPTDFTKTTDSVTYTEDPTMWNYVNNHDQYTKNHNFDVDYVEAADAGTERHFDIDQPGKQEVLVYNTEQLFMAVQYGARPIFDNTTSVAYQCYANAKQILSEINSDSLTDYQKALNIYIYLCTNVTYDHVLLDYMSYVNNFTVNKFGKFNVFYIESILYDLENQISVCDGIAKTFTLLCQIEGINASKINGSANLGNGSSGLHAWNRVCLNDNWYIVDCTWGVASYAEDTNKDGSADTCYEAFTYTYFLVSEAEIANTHDADYQIDSSATISYNFYKNHTVSVNAGGSTLTIDLYIENDSDFVNLKKYMYYSGKNFINVKFSEAYLRTMCTSWLVDDALEIKNYLSQATTVDGRTYYITGYMNYGLNSFLLIGSSSYSGL